MTCSGITPASKPLSACPAKPYRKFNFSPSGQWAAYAFSDYCQRDEGFELPDTPRITTQLFAGRLEVDGTFFPSTLPTDDCTGGHSNGCVIAENVQITAQRVCPHGAVKLAITAASR